MKKKISVSLDDLQDDDAMLGVCVECGDFDDGYESDAQKCECGTCGKKSVYGLMVAFELGLIEVS